MIPLSKALQQLPITTIKKKKKTQLVSVTLKTDLAPGHLYESHFTTLILTYSAQMH